jgi:hypothetical protein
MEGARKIYTGAALDRAGLDNQSTDGGEFASPTRSTPQKHFSASGTHFCYRLWEP